MSIWPHILCACALWSTGVVGRKYSRMIGGEYAQPGQFPSVVSIHSKSGKHICEGVLIARQFILTAAHCFPIREPFAYMVQSGSYEYEVDDLLLHEAFHSKLMTNDIALARLKEPIDENEYVSPVAILPKDFHISEGTIVTAVGMKDWKWVRRGRQIPFQFLQMKIEENEECAGARSVTSQEMCAGGDGLCYGDAGGPLYYNHYLIGLTSHVKRCRRGSPSVFTNISAYRDWILDGMRLLNENSVNEYYEVNDEDYTVVV